MTVILNNRSSISKTIPKIVLTTSITLMPSLANTSVPLSELTHRHVTSSASTNSELLAAIQSGTLPAAERYLLTADTQSAGRGQRGRSWQSPRGNVYLSLYYPLHLPISGLLSLIIGVELAKIPAIHTLNERLSTQGLTAIGVKWANDLGFYQSQRLFAKQIIPFNKLAGILIEPVSHMGKLVGVVMGVGLNVQATPKLTAQTCEGMSYQAISLQDIYQLAEGEENTASLPTLAELYQQISHALIAAMTRFEYLAAEKPTGQTYYLDNFLRQFDSMDALAGLRLRVTQNHNGAVQTITGHACGIDEHGCLQLRQDNGKLSALFTGRIDVIDEA